LQSRKGKGQRLNASKLTGEKARIKCKKGKREIFKSAWRSNNKS